jgi:hypothetical protein
VRSRRRRARPRARSRSAALVAVVLALAGTPPAAGAPTPRFTGEVTDALRTPTHRLVANPQTGKAAGDLLFSDADGAKTAVRACVIRRDGTRLRTCFKFTTGAAGTPTVTPLRFPRGRYVVRWSVADSLVAHWRLEVV